MREKPQPETYFDGYYIIFDHKFWVERRHEEDNFENFLTEEQEEQEDKQIEQMIQKIVEPLDQSNNVNTEKLYKLKKDRLEKELKSRRESRESLSLGHYWRFHVKPNGSLDFVGETEGNLPTNPSLAMPKC